MANILLLSMSLYNRELSEHYYVAEDENYVFCGVSQLEAGTKYFLRKLQKQEEKLDKIIVIESREVRGEKRSVTEWLNGSLPKNAMEMTATDFYQKRIIQYINGSEEYMEYRPNLTEKAEAYEKTLSDQCSLKKLYPEPEGLFETVEMGEGDNDVYDCIKTVCERIRIFSENNEKIKLYLDMQGARRYETFVINTVVKMLEISDIKVQESVAVDFAAGNTKKGIANTIVDTTDNNIILEMVSGVNEFIRTGRGDTLREFWQKYRKIPGIKKDGKASGIIGQIRQTADAISLCDVEGFEKNLNELKKTLEDYEIMGDEDKQPMFQMLVTELKEDYFGPRHDLLPDDERMKIVNQIRWCVDKKLYQQALALVEEKIPENIVNSRILYYGDSEKLTKLVNGMLDNGWSCPPYYLWTNGNHRQVKEEKAAMVWIKYVMEYRRERNGREIAAKRYVEQYVNAVTKPIRKNANCKWEPQIGDLLKCYQDLNEQRNKVMHATAENYDAATIKKLLMQFANKYEDLLKQGATYDYSLVRPLM